MKLEERVNDIAAFSLFPLDEVRAKALEHLRAVAEAATKAAYERAADVAESELDAARAWVEYGFVILKAFSRTAQKIRALADGGKIDD